MTLAALLKPHVESAVADKLYQTKPLNTPDKVAEVHLGFLPPKRETVEQGEDYPFVLIRLLGGPDSYQSRGFTILLYGGLYAKEIADGLVDIEDLADRLLSLRESRELDPYSACEGRVHYGDKQGNQPLPYFECFVEIEFTKEPRPR